jgi:LemA protein
VAGEYLQHDPQAMLPLMQARNAVSGANDALRSQPSSGRLVQLLMDAEQGLQDRIDHFWTDVSTLAMQADPKLRELAQQLSATQSRLAFACQSFNVAVAQFNAAQVQFPTLLLARLFGFAPAVALQLGPSRA